MSVNLHVIFNEMGHHHYELHGLMGVTLLDSIFTWSMKPKWRFIVSSYSSFCTSNLFFISFSVSRACRTVNSRCWFCMWRRQCTCSNGFLQYRNIQSFFVQDKRIQFFLDELYVVWLKQTLTEYADFCLLYVLRVAFCIHLQLCSTKLLNGYMQGSYTFVKTKFKAFSRTFKSTNFKSSCSRP